MRESLRQSVPEIPALAQVMVDQRDIKLIDWRVGRWRKNIKTDGKHHDYMQNNRPDKGQYHPISGTAGRNHSLTRGGFRESPVRHHARLI